MKHPILKSTEYTESLALADGSIWNIIAANDRAYDVVSALAKAMQFQALGKSALKKSYHNIFRRLIVHVEGHKTDSAQLFSKIHLAFDDEGTIVCTLISKENIDTLAMSLMHLSMVICRDAQYRGGVSLHGALAGWNRNGVILAGPTGRGKTTLSKRLPHHWQSLCDDTTLAVYDNKGKYWAHPWPTWSAFMFGGLGGTWDVQHALPLKGIFFLEQAHEDEFERIGVAQSVCLLNESSKQASFVMSHYMEKDELRRHRQMCFENICALAQTVPSYILRLSRDGAFWQVIEKVLND
jgi:SynChlorMet cassette protein ScmC